MSYSLGNRALKPLLNSVVDSFPKTVLPVMVDGRTGLE